MPLSVSTNFPFHLGPDAIFSHTEDRSGHTE